MAATLTIDVDLASARFSPDRALVLGSSYALAFTGDAPGGAPTLILTDCGGTTVAASQDGALSLTSENLLRAMPCGAGRDHACPRAEVFHGYLVADGATVALGEVAVLWSPVSFSPAGLPQTLRGEKGEKGDKGDKGDAGRDGRNGVYVPASGLYAFHVSDERGEDGHPEPGHLYVHSQDLSSLYARDASGQPLLDGSGDPIPLFAVDESGHLVYRFYCGDTRHQALDLGPVRTQAGLYALHVADGTVEGEEAGHLIRHGQDLAQLYACDASGQPILDPQTGERIPLFALDENGHLHFRFFGADGQAHQTLDIGSVKGPKGDPLAFEDLTEEQKASLKGPKGDPGADGMTETQIRELVASAMGTPDNAPVPESRAWVTSGGLYNVALAWQSRHDTHERRIAALEQRLAVPALDAIARTVEDIDGTGDAMRNFSALKDAFLRLVQNLRALAPDTP